MAGVGATPLAAETAVEQLAETLLATEPHTSEHWNAWGAYLLGIAIGAEIENAERDVRITEHDLNAAYLANLGEVASRVGAAVMIPPLDWRLRKWRQETRILCSAVHTDGLDLDNADWNNVIESLATGVITLYDRRALNERFLRHAAFRRLG